MASLLRGVAILFFGIGGFVMVVGGLASFLFHDGILPDDRETYGWEAVFSFGRAFFPSLAIALVCLSLGLIVSRFAKNRRTG